MVALKLSHGKDLDPARAWKQERRGGIETSPAPRCPSLSSGKQERRGGIETGVSMAKFPWARRKRSRNAVVALKRVSREALLWRFF